MFHINPIVNINRKRNDLCIWVVRFKIAVYGCEIVVVVFDSEMCLTRARGENGKCGRTVCERSKAEVDGGGKNSMKIVRLQTIIINKGWQVKNIRFITNWIKTNKIVSDTDIFAIRVFALKLSEQASTHTRNENYHIPKFITIIVFICWCFGGFHHLNWHGMESKRIDYIIEEYFYLKTIQSIAMNRVQNEQEHLTLNRKCCSHISTNGFIGRRIPILLLLSALTWDFAWDKKVYAKLQCDSR